MLTRNKRLNPAHAAGPSATRRLKPSATALVGLGVAGLVAAAMIPQQVTAQPLAVVHAAATKSSVDRTLKDPAIDESSGLARSAYSSTRLWTHNDSGGGTYLYALGANGETTATFNLGDASHKDWEGMAQDTSGGVSYLYLGDIGDNGAKRTSIFIHKVREPAVSAAGSTLTPTTYEFKYSDGPHNAEAMMVNPTTHRIYVITKIRATKGLGAIYAAPTTLSTTKVNVLTKVGSAPSGLSDAVWLDNGSFILRDYVSAWLYTSIGATPTRFPVPLKGESVAQGFSPSYIFVGSEHRYSSIWRVGLP